MDERYELREKIGQGGIGSVHRAYDRTLGREVAIKRILSSEDDPSLKEEATKQLRVEAGALASLQHPNIVMVLDVGSDEEGPYVVMEMINGKTLDEMIESGPLNWDDCKQVAMQSLEALIAAEELNMIHSDLKPPNIMLTWLASGSFQVKVLDFGLAVLIHNQSQEEIEKLESMFGSIFFMPPEQFERKVLDARSDLYSLGCCFYQALTGTYPFRGESGEEVMASHLNHTVFPVDEIRGGVPIWACQWIMWLINRKPEDRPESARVALANFIQNDSLPCYELSLGGEQPIIPNPIDSTDFAKESPSLQPSDGEGAALPFAPEAQRKFVLPKPSKLHLKIAAVAASLLLLGSLFWMIKQRNDRIARGNTYNYIVSMAAADHVREVQISGEHLQILLESIRDSKPDANLVPAYRALVIAKASDSTNIDTTIADFATSDGVPSSIRKKLFSEVIKERDAEASAPALIRFSAKASNPEEAAAAIDAISEMVGDIHFEGLLGVLSSSSQPKVTDAVEGLLMTIIRKSSNRGELAQLISSKGKGDGSQASTEALNRLMAFAKPQAQQPNKPAPKPAPAPAPNPKPPSNPKLIAPDNLVACKEAVTGGDDAKKIEAITALGNSTQAEAHAILIACAGIKENAHLRIQAFQALTKLNSNPPLVENGDQARQRWVQITWAAKSPDEEKLIIDAVSKIQKDWVKGILEQMALYGKSPATKELAQRALQGK